MKIKKYQIKDLIRAEYNPRKLTKVQEQDLKDSLTRFGLVDPILVNVNKERENIIIGGHQRVKVWESLGNTEVDCIELDLTLDKERELNVRLNKNTGGWDDELLKDYFEYEELIEWGFTPDEIFDEEEKVVEGNIDDDEIPEVKESRVVKGDIWKLGEHRIMCGDSTNVDDVEKLMNGEKADMVFTDPPYGISVVKNEKVGADFGIAKKGKYSEVIADDTTKTAQEFYNTCISLGMDNFIIWGGNYFVDFLPFSSGWLIWNKRANTNIRNTFADGEMAWCSFHTPIRIYDQLWNGMIREGESGKRVHPTQKPLRTLSEIIKDHIKGDIIYDGFLGSGSTIIACEKTNRKCYGMELDEKYCNVIIERWEQFTGKKAEKIQ
jgi:DNA modification methylase